MEMAALTLDGLNALPALRASSHVDDIVCLHVHTHLPKRPATVVTDAGHYRMPITLYGTAARAYATLANNGGAYEGPRRGTLAEVLHAMAGDDDRARRSAEEPLGRLAECLAEEALGELEGLLASRWPGCTASGAEPW